MGKPKPRALIIGGQFTGTFTASDLKKKFEVTVVDCKEYFEYTPGILRAYVKPCHLDALTFTLEPVLQRSVGVRFLWGEVQKLNEKDALVQPMFAQNTEKVEFDFCVICSGCNFNPFHKMGESLWFPTVHEKARKESAWGHIDERFLEGRRRHILEEYHKLHDLNKKKATVLVVGAGFIGVEWATEIEYFFPQIQLTIIDFLPRALGPLPDIAAEYCSSYMSAVGIKEFYGKKYAGDDPAFWKEIELPDKADVQYICIGVKASNYFVPEKYLSKKGQGPGGGGWIWMNQYLQVTTESGEVWNDGSIFAVGDCNMGGIKMNGFEMPPVPKISYPGEEQALHAVHNIKKLAKGDKSLYATWWPWGAGMFATSLGPHDACFVLAANHNKGSGYMVNWWIPAALQKEIIESTKIHECKNGFLGKLIWHFVHHTPIHCWGQGFKRSGGC